MHGANGYLLDQFTRDSTNKRDDVYGGSVENRCRLPLEITDAVVDVWGATGWGTGYPRSRPYNDISDSDPEATFCYLTTELAKRKSCLPFTWWKWAETKKLAIFCPAETSSLRNCGTFGRTPHHERGYDRAKADAVIEVA